MHSQVVITKNQVLIYNTVISCGLVTFQIHNTLFNIPQSNYRYRYIIGVVIIWSMLKACADAR